MRKPQVGEIYQFKIEKEDIDDAGNGLCLILTVEENLSENYPFKVSVLFETGKYKRWDLLQGDFVVIPNV